ncbi:probable maltase [Macrosteles quadrilineatus]|uniref:probable maltase n=1 Tax=Macrosteles quadrilineatus TaxID=74068 RepID=UPI0023E1C872|nr:probable maltase [Macrosteles quadrilineatus]
MKPYSLLVFLFAAFFSQATGELPWYRRTNFYQVYPRSFKDSDGDGTGDLKGVAQKAQHFKDIGLDAIWLSPFFPSPNKDFGYDVSDFKNVDPLYGNMDDFKNLAKTLAGLGIKFVIDFVPNHSSDLHPWFQLSVNRTHPYTDYYVWDNGTIDDGGKHHPPNNWLSVFGGSAWEWHEGRQQYYYHAFLKEQPDLNYNNPAVVAEMEDVIRFWLDIGVDGFRLDSANYMFESDNRSENETLIPGETDATQWKNYVHNLTQNQDKTYELFHNWALIFYNYSTGKSGKPRALFMEVYTDLDHTIMYYGHGNTSLMFPFNFELLVQGNQSLTSSDFKRIIDSWLDKMPKDGVANWVVGNHDNGRVADRYGFEMVDAINLLTGVLPGMKVTYYGDEIGMRNTFVRWSQNVDPSGQSLGPDNYLKASRDPERTPMQWDSSPSAGFSSNKTTWLPVNPDYWWLNVEKQKAADSSHLKVFQTLSKVRQDEVLLNGTTKVLAPDDDTLIILRTLNSSYFALLINLGSELREYTTLDLALPSNVDVQVVIVSENVEHKIGDKIAANSTKIQLRPKAAILVKSSATQLFLSLPLFVCLLLGNFWR